MEKPLAIKLRPTKLNEIIGQDHLTSKGAPLYNLVHNGKVFSIINQFSDLPDSFREIDHIVF